MIKSLVIVAASMVGIATAQSCDSIDMNPLCRAVPGCTWESGECVPGGPTSPPDAPLPAFAPLVCPLITKNPDCRADPGCEWVQGECVTRPYYSFFCARQLKYPECQATQGCRWVKGACVNEPPEFCVANLEETGIGLTIGEFAVQDESRFNMDLALSIGTANEAFLTKVFEESKQVWETSIVGEGDLLYPTNGTGLSSACADNPSPGVIDDLYICGLEVCLDGPGNILGAAGPTYIRVAMDATYGMLPLPLPVAGIMYFDTDDIAYFSKSDTLSKIFRFIVEHEIGHVLGIGSLWNFFSPFSLIDADSRYKKGALRYSLLREQLEAFPTLVHAVWEQLWGCVGQVPIEQEFGPGSAGSHWDEGCFDHELMSPQLDLGDNPASLLTLAVLADYGYEVDLSQANFTYMPRQDCCNGTVDYGQLDPTRHLRGEANKKEPQRPMFRKLHGPDDRGLSEEGLGEAIAYGQDLLRKAGVEHSSVQDPSGLQFIGDEIITVYYVEGDSLCEVPVEA